MNAVTWGGRLFIAGIAAAWIIIGVIYVREKWCSAAKVIEDARNEIAARETRPGAGLFCLWCHPSPAGRAGRCGCDSKCPDVDHCIGDYTTLSGPEFAAQLEEMLRGDGNG